MHEKKNVNYAKAILGGCLKSSSSKIPYIGPLIECGIAMWDNYHAKRDQDFTSDLSKKLSRMDEAKVDKEYIQSEEFYDLMHRAWRTRILHRSQLKARFIVGLVADSIRNDRDREFTTSLKESFLIILDQLTNEEMKLLYDFSEGKYDRINKEQFYAKAIGTEIDGLIAKGILTVDASWGQAIVYTALGKRFVSYMRLLAKDNL